MIELFRYSMPDPDICMEKELYFRTVGKKEPYYNSLTHALEMSKGCEISFDTYFNAFSKGKYGKYTKVKEVGFELDLQGEFEITIMSARADGSNLSDSTDMVLGSFRVSFEERGLWHHKQDFRFDLGDGIYYLKVKAESKKAIIYDGRYYAEDINTNNVKLAVVICTFKREEYVYRNLNNVQKYIFGDSQCGIKENIEFLIIDNGKTIQKDRFAGSQEHIHILPNKNYGGSGGFTRGVLEAYRKRDYYTHVLLMDDDILFDCKVLEKTIHFLEVLADNMKDISIGGAMNRLDKRYWLNDEGGYWAGHKIVGMRNNLDMRERSNILLNEIGETPAFEGWWYTCMPISSISEEEFPLPLFIKWDDVEYGSRVAKRIVTMNGIGIWHEHFDFKYSMHLMYYEMRNQLIVNAVHGKKAKFRDAMSIAWYYIKRQLMFQRYEAVDLVIRGCKDFLKGVDFLKNLNEEELNKELMQCVPRQYSADDLQKEFGVSFIYENYENSLKHNHGRKKDFIRKITLNGYLVPKCLYKKNGMGYRIVDIVRCEPDNFCREKRVLQYNIAEGKGFMTKCSKIKALTGVCKTIGLYFVMMFRYKKAFEDFKNNYHEITSYDFWCKHLEI